MSQANLLSLQSANNSLYNWVVMCHLRESKRALTKMKKLKMNMRYLMQLRQSPSILVPLPEASPCPWINIVRNKESHYCHMLRLKMSPWVSVVSDCWTFVFWSSFSEIILWICHLNNTLALTKHTLTNIFCSGVPDE